MPPESLTVAVTSGFGIGILAGIVSGVCYILVHGFSVNRPRTQKNQWNCNVCGERFRSIGGVLETDKVITCLKCGGKVCRKKCSNQDKEGWICQTCQNPESWFKGILKALHPSSYSKTEKNMNPNKIDEIDEDLEAIKQKEKEQVRDFIERLVEGMLGGSIDNASIGRLYNDKQYDILIARYHSDLSNTLTDLGSALHMSIANLPVVGQSPCSTHAGLKLLIQRIIQEAIGLPTLAKIPDHPGKPTEEINRTYEELLATAIINKVIESDQDERPSSSANSVSSRRSNRSGHTNKEYFFGDETLDSKWRSGNNATFDVDTTSVSSVEEWVRSDSSAGSTKYVDHNSLTIQQRIQEASSSEDESNLDKKGKEWQENWKLQKRQFAGTASPIPVPMLVPNPTVEAKVLIGDREAEDTTDLSDAGSEFGDSERVEEVESVLVDSNSTFVRTNVHIPDVEVENQILSDGSTDDSDIVREKDRVFEKFTSLQDTSIHEEISESINQEVINQTETAEDTSLDSHFEQDTEYTEKYATLPRTILKCSTPIKSISQNYNNLEDGLANKNSEIAMTESDISVNEDVEFRDMFKGTYSEREKQKWQNAIEMKNNPYTEENINRRLSQTSNGTSVIFGRDYYIKEAAKAAGARSNKISVDDVVSGKLQESTNEPNISEEFIFKALPAIVNAEDSIYTSVESPIEVTSPTIPSLLEISSDSDLSIERTYNLTSGKVYEKIGNIHKEIIKRTSSPEGLKFVLTDTEIDGVVIDENHNAMTQDRKRTFLRSLTNSDGNENEKTDLPVTPSDDVFVEQSISNVINNDVPLKINNQIEPQKEVLNEPKVESIDYVDNNKTFTIQEISIDFSTEGEEVKTSVESSLNSNPDTEIVDLKVKHLVKDRLGQFSKSYPNLASVPLRKIDSKLENSHEEEARHSSHELLPQTNVSDSSINNLRRKFSASKEDIIQKQVHSLTARSISQVIRKELQEVEHQKHEEPVYMKTEVASPQKVAPQDSLKEVAEGLPIFPNAKSRIKFFENLNR